MREKPLPPELARRWGHLPDLTYRSNNEWSSACVQCGGADVARHDKSDRFRMFAPEPGKGARGFCRKCGYFDWADGDKKQKPSPEQLLKAEVERRKFAEAEIKRLQEMIAWLSQSRFWLEAHEAMTNQQRRAWLEHVPEWAIDMHRFGYFDHEISLLGPSTETFVHKDSLSIPYLEGGMEPEHIQSLQLRLQNVQAGEDRYRFLKGFKGSDRLFYPLPVATDMDGVVIVVEGAKKALWLFNEIEGFPSYRDRPATIVALPSKWLDYNTIHRFKDTEVVIWMLDPDANFPDPKTGKVTVEINAEKVGKEKSRFVRLPGKIDDLITDGIYQAPHLKELINQASAA